jgi:hypothetical protein
MRESDTPGWVMIAIRATRYLRRANLAFLTKPKYNCGYRHDYTTHEIFVIKVRRGFLKVCVESYYEHWSLIWGAIVCLVITRDICVSVETGRFIAIFYTFLSGFSIEYI